MIIADSETGTAKIIDYDSSINDVKSIIDENSPYVFRVMEKGSIIKNISMGSVLPDKIKTAALYAINGLAPDVNGSALGRMFGGVSDSYLDYLKNKTPNTINNKNKV